MQYIYIYICNEQTAVWSQDGTLDEYVVKFTVPVGNQNHNLLVMVGSLTFTVLGTLYLVYVICISNQNQDLIDLIKSHKAAKSKLDQRKTHYYRDKRGGGGTKQEQLKESLKALFMGGSGGGGGKSNGVIEKESSSLRKRYKQL